MAGKYSMSMHYPKFPKYQRRSVPVIDLMVTTVLCEKKTNFLGNAFFEIQNRADNQNSPC